MNAPRGIYAIRAIPAIVQERAYTRVRVADDGCWVSTYKPTPAGYATLMHRDPDTGKDHAYLAHRASYTHANGAIPDGLLIDHMCFNRACVNPAHLRAITNLQNSQRRQTVGHDFPMDECGYGHKYSEYLVKTTTKQGKPRQYCKACYQTKQDGANARRDALKRLELTYGIRLTAQQQGMVDEFMPAVQLPIHSSTEGDV